MKFTISADGQEETAKWFYMNTTAKPVQKDTQDNKDNKDTDEGKDTGKGKERDFPAFLKTAIASDYKKTISSRMPAVTVTEKQLTAEDPVEVRMEVKLREMVLFRV